MNKTLTIILIVLGAIGLSLLIDQKTLSELLEKMIFNAVAVLVGLSIAVVGIS
jgi:hypothetical protein